jgi:hypothetical protein
VLRAQLEAICKAACTEKCPDIGTGGAPICPLRQFEDESQEDYLRRCEAATQLAQVAAERENADIDDIGAEILDESGLEDVDIDEPLD